MVKVLGSLYDAFVGLDAMLMEINPLVLTEDGRVVALDAKVTIDGNAVYRRPELTEIGDVLPEDPQERMAKERGVTYVKLDGDVGILGNGAGLVMSTLDVVALAGGRPANFLDAGGGSKADDVVTALEVLLSDEKVKVLLINIFGGITRCDEVAEGLLDRPRPAGRHAAHRGAPGRHQRGGGAGDHRRARAGQRRRGDDDALGRPTSGGPRRGGAGMSILVDASTRLVVQGITGREGAFHATRNKAYGTQVVAGVTPGKAGQDVDGHPGVQHRGGRRRGHRREHRDGLRAAAVRRRRHPRGARQPRGPDRLHHGGHPGARHAPRLRPPEARRQVAGRSQLPGHHQPRNGHRGDHADAGLRARSRWAWSAAAAR